MEEEPKNTTPPLQIVEVPVTAPDALPLAALLQEQWAADPVIAMEKIVGAVLGAGLVDKYALMVKIAHPINPDGSWNHDSVTVLLKLGEVVTKFLTKMNRMDSSRRRRGIGLVRSLEDKKAQMEQLKREIEAAEKTKDDARQSWKSGGVNRLRPHQKGSA